MKPFSPCPFLRICILIPVPVGRGQCALLSHSWEWKVSPGATVLRPKSCAVAHPLVGWIDRAAVCGHGPTKFAAPNVAPHGMEGLGVPHPRLVLTPLAAGLGSSRASQG